MTGEAVCEDLSPITQAGTNELASGTTKLRGDAGSHDRQSTTGGAARVKASRNRGKSPGPDEAWEGVEGARYGQSARIPTQTDTY